MSKQDKTEKLAFETMETFGVLTDQVETIYGGANIKFQNIKGIATGKFRDFLAKKDQVNERGEYMFVGVWPVSTTPSETHFTKRMDKFFKQQARKIAVAYRMNNTPLLQQRKAPTQPAEMTAEPKLFLGPQRMFRIKLMSISNAVVDVKATNVQMAKDLVNEKLRKLDEVLNLEWQPEIGEIQITDNKMLDPDEKADITYEPDYEFLDKYQHKFKIEYDA